MITDQLFFVNCSLLYYLFLLNIIKYKLKKSPPALGSVTSRNTQNKKIKFP